VGSAKWQCADDTITDDSALGQWGKVFWEGGKKFGRTFRVIEDDVQRTGMTKAGFADLEVREWKVPATAWPDAEAEPEMKNIGAYIQLAFDEDLEGKVSSLRGRICGTLLRFVDLVQICLLITEYPPPSRLVVVHVERRHGLVTGGSHGLPGPLSTAAE